MHEKWMQRAIDNALKAWGHTSPNPHVGALIVKNEQVIADGWHKKAGEKHAEKDAIANAQGQDLSGSTIYVTLEPCCTTGRTGPCTQSIIDAGIAKVVYGCTDTNPDHAGKGFEVLKQAGIAVEGPVLEQECREMNRFFFTWINEKRPYVILKMAQTLDGKIATKNGHSQWITGPEARYEVQKLRQGCDAIIVGGETVRQDNPSLNVREIDNPKHPKRFVWTQSDVDENAKVFTQEGGAEYCRAQSEEEWLNFLEYLGEQEITSLLVEGGGWLADSCLKAGIVDEIQFFIAPKILGGSHSRLVVSGPDPFSLDEAIQLYDMQTKKVGNDLLIKAKVGY